MLLRQTANLALGLTIALAACAEDIPQAEAAGITGSATGQSQPAPVPTTAKDGIKGGHCAAAFPSLAKRSWRHKIGSSAVKALGAANHRLRDLILLPGQLSSLRGRFTYGSADKDLEDETVELYLQSCPGWQLVSTKITNADGVVQFDLPANLPTGDYRVRAVVRGDNSGANGMVAIWPKGVQVVVSDVDGTLTTSDWQLFKDLLTQKPATMFADADKAIGTWADKGYRILYLTGRPQLFNKYSHDWLDSHGLPPGVVRLTDDAADVVPAEAGVQVFKTEVLKALIASHGAKIRAGHGNATTDIGAYQAAGIPNEDLYIIGPHAGKSGSTAVQSYTALLGKLAKYPEAVQP